MFAVSASARIFLATGVTDLRKGFNGLYAIIEYEWMAKPLSGDLFLFCNRRRDCLKVFVFDGSGFWLCAKRLESGTFRWPVSTAAYVHIGTTEFQMLLGGVDPSLSRKRDWWSPVS